MSLSLALTIEGSANQWVTDNPGSAASGVTPRRGLSYAGIVMSERANIGKGTYEADSITVQIVCSDESNDDFTRAPRILTYLSESVLSTSATTFNVRSNSLLSDGDYVHIGTEALLIDDASTLAVEMTRAQLNSSAQIHARREGAEASEVQVWNKPLAWEGRRATITAVEDGGTEYVAFVGVIDRPPYLSEDHTRWLIDIAHVSKKLEQTVGAPIGGTASVRGIKYGRSSSFGLTVNGAAQVKLTGFFENDDAFLSALNTELDGVTITGVDDVWADIGDSRYDTPGNVPGLRELRLWLTINSGADIAAPYLEVGSVLDGFLTMYYLDTGAGTSGLFVPQETLLAGNTYLLRFAGRLRPGSLAQQGSAFAQSPRVSFGGPRAALYVREPFDHPWSLGSVSNDDEEDLSIAITEDLALAAGDVLELTGPRFPAPLRLTIVSDDGDNKYQISGSGLSGYCSTHGLGAIVIDAETAIAPLKSLGTGDLSDFVTAVIASAPWANLGGVPYLTGADIDPSTTDVDEATLGFAALQNRDYTSAEDVSIADLLSPELLLLGMMIGTDDDGELCFKSFTLPGNRETPTATVGASQIVTRYQGAGMFPAWAPATDGIVSAVRVLAGKSIVVRTGFFATIGGRARGPRDPHEYAVRDIASTSAHKTRGASTMSIEPEVNANADFSQTEALAVAGRIISVMGHPYEVVTIRTVRTAELRAVYIGDILRITSTHVPNSGDGTRGVTSRNTRVIGRRIGYDPADGAAEIEFTVIMRGASASDAGQWFAGYAPSAATSGATNVSGNTWDVTVAEFQFGPPGQGDTSFFEVDDFVRVVATDDSTPTSQTGTLSAISATVMRVVFDGAAPWGGSYSGSYVVEFANVATGLTDAMDEYCYTADSGLLLSNGNPARTFA